MPTGNGRLGATMYGGVDDERIDLNESSMWSGSRHDSDRPDAAKSLPEIRRLLLAGDNVGAEALVNKSFTSVDRGSADPRYGCYQELGQLLLHFPALAEQATSGYQRSLDLDGAVARTTFAIDGVPYTREVFTSAPDQVIVVRLTAGKPHALTFDVGLTRAERFTTSVVAGDILRMTGELDSGAPKVLGVAYAAEVKVVATGGNVSRHGAGGLHVESATAVTLLVSAATNYRGFAGRETSDPQRAAADDLARASRMGYGVLRARHQADYRHYFERVSLALGPEDAAVEARPAVERIKAANAGADDPGLAALYFNFGRYLLISSSRPGGLPANLQGIWAEGTRTPWNGDWHLDVNLQMNYWPAESTALGDLTGPLFALIASLEVPGARTAKAYYDAPGWVAHVITNPWGYTSPGEEASWGSTTIGSAWLCQHIWSHYLYSGDVAFLRRMYPALKGASEFYLAMLVKEPKHGWLVTAPSNSPESTFYLADGRKASVTMGPAIDEENLRALFTSTAEAAARLNVDAEFRAKLAETTRQLAPIQIGPDGRVMEWLEPYREVEPQHRHVSHLWALYPGDEIDRDRTPKLAEAARRTLEVRGDGATGWSLAYKMLLWTRLGDGDHAYRLLRNLWQPIDPVHPDGAGSLPNLFDVCPPFQIDGNFGATAAIAEMLIDSRPGVLRVLPALPAALPEGRVDGLQAMGGVTAGVTWTAGKATEIRLTAARPVSMLLRYGGASRTLNLRAGQQVKLDASLLPLSTR